MEYGFGVRDAGGPYQSSRKGSGKKRFQKYLKVGNSSNEDAGERSLGW